MQLWIPRQGPPPRPPGLVQKFFIAETTWESAEAEGRFWGAPLIWPRAGHTWDDLGLPSLDSVYSLEGNGICPTSCLLGSFMATRRQKRSPITWINNHYPHLLASHLSLLKRCSFLPRKLFPPFPFSYEGEWISPCVQSLEASAVLSAAKCTGINVACFAHVHSSAACRFNLHAPGAEPKRVEEVFLHRTHHALPPNGAPAGERICPGDLMSDTAWRARRSVRSLSKRSSVPCAVSVSGIPQGLCTQRVCQALCREHTCPSVGADPSLVLYGYSSGCTGSLPSLRYLTEMGPMPGMPGPAWEQAWASRGQNQAGSPV